MSATDPEMPDPATMYGIPSQTPAQRASQFGTPQQGPTPQQRRMMMQRAMERKRRFEEQKKAREQQKAIERIKAQVVYSPVMTSPANTPGMMPVPRSLGIVPGKDGIPIGIRENSLSPQDRAVYLAMADTERE